MVAKKNLTPPIKPPTNFFFNHLIGSSPPLLKVAEEKPVEAGVLLFKIAYMTIPIKNSTKTRNE